jgi:hypothetical protein
LQSGRGIHENVTIQLTDAVQQGFTKVIIRTVDTDAVIIAIAILSCNT